MIKKIGRFFLWLFIGLIVLALLSIRPYDDTPYKEQPFYKGFKETKIKPIYSTDTTELVKVGWAKKSITPELGVPMAGYGPRPEVSEISDSIFVRAIVFEQGSKRIVSLAYDLLMVHPDLVQEFERKFFETHQFNTYQFYYSAIHSHSSIGGWSKGLVSKFTLGGYDEKVMANIVDASIEAIDEGYEDVQPTQIAYQTIEAKGFAKNRVNDTCEVDEVLRNIHFKQEDGSKAVWSSFSVHPTNVEFRTSSLSADYPKGFHDECKGQGEFSVFSAGMVGSHETNHNLKSQLDLIRSYGRELAQLQYSDTNKLKWRKLKSVKFQHHIFEMPKMQVRFSSKWCLSQLMIDLLLDEQKFPIRTLSLNEYLVIGMPCDFSGELFPMIKSEIKPMITSFNGNYIGYINHPQHYFMDSHNEVRDLTWLGEEGGFYAVEAIEKVLKK